MANSIVIYVRCSTKQQANNGFSLSYQQNIGIEYASSNNLNIKGVFVDRGISGKYRYNRKSLENALNSLSGGDIFWIYSITRLTRSMTDFFDIKKEIENKGAKLISHSENLNDDFFSYGISALLSEYESLETSKRIKDVLRYKKEIDGTTNNKAPYGWKYDKNVKDQDGKLIPVAIESEQIIIHKILEMRKVPYRNPKFRTGKIKSTPYKNIADSLNNDGIPTRNKSNNPKCKWAPSTIKNIIDFYEFKDPKFVLLNHEDLLNSSKTNTIENEYIYLIVTNNSKEIGGVKQPIEIYNEYHKRKGAIVYMFPCESSQDSKDHMIAWLLAQKYVDIEDDEEVLLPNIDHVPILSYMKEYTKENPIEIQIRDIPSKYPKIAI